MKYRITQNNNEHINNVLQKEISNINALKEEIKEAFVQYSYHRWFQNCINGIDHLSLNYAHLSKYIINLYALPMVLRQYKIKLTDQQLVLLERLRYYFGNILEVVEPSYYEEDGHSSNDPKDFIKIQAVRIIKDYQDNDNGLDTISDEEEECQEE